MKKTALLAVGASAQAAETLLGQWPDEMIDKIDCLLTGAGQPLGNTHGLTEIVVDPVAWRDQPEATAQMLDANGVGTVIVPDFAAVAEVPPQLVAAFGGEFIDVSTFEMGCQIAAQFDSSAGESLFDDKAADFSEQEADREALAEQVELEEEWHADGDPIKSEGDDTPPPVSAENPGTAETDRQWAERLGLEYDPSKITPPPLPEAETEPKPWMQNADYGRPQPGQGGNVHGGNRAPQPGEPMPPTYLLWAVLSLVLCCFIPGVVAVIFASQVSSRYYAGDLAGAWRASRNAEIWIIVSFVLGVLSATLYLPIMLLV